MVSKMQPVLTMLWVFRKVENYSHLLCPRKDFCKGTLSLVDIGGHWTQKSVV